MAIAEVAEAITVDFDLEDGPVFIPTKRYTDPRDVLVRCSRNQKVSIVGLILDFNLC
jgi:hypothetical protein